MRTANNIPTPTSPMLGPDGKLSQVWWQFFLTLFARTGGLQGGSITDASSEASAGIPLTDLAPVYSAIYAVEAMASQAMSAAAEQQDERGEAGNADASGYIARRIVELEMQLEQYRSDDSLRARVADLEAKVEAFGALAPVPTGYDSLTIGANPRTVAYY